MTNSTSPTALLDVALDAARLAVEVHRRDAGRVRTADSTEKGTADFVSRTDTDAEIRIVDRIRASFPDHEILAEEAATLAGVPGPDPEAEPGESAATSSPETTGPVPTAARAPAAAHGVPAPPEWLWYIDPLDGTTNFLHGYPMYAASVAVAHRGELLAAAVISGASGETWTATRGGGAHKDGRRIRASETVRLDQALIGTGFPFKALDLLPAYLEQFARILRATSGIRRAGSAAIDLCHLATGWFDGFWELHLAPWDVAAGTLIAREAGALVTTLDGRADVLRHGGILAGNAAIHEGLRQHLHARDGAA